MAQQVPVDDAAQLLGRKLDDATEIASDVAYRRLGIVNIVYFGEPSADLALGSYRCRRDRHYSNYRARGGKPFRPRCPTRCHRTDARAL